MYHVYRGIFHLLTNWRVPVREAQLLHILVHDYVHYMMTVRFSYFAMAEVLQ